ncbi:hypothetical protein LCGC14_0360270 [marine sediment metagenome]|uniref:Uncharacterized protein n=1 Tax=marine sediment metagenome TaxID=412755 RepID=A0A0F9WGI5_9ZZZZ
MKTKNYEISLTGNISWRWRWTFLFSLEREYVSKEYTEIHLHILCFGISFMAISHKYAAKLDDMVKTIIEKTRS